VEEVHEEEAEEVGVPPAAPGASHLKRLLTDCLPQVSEAVAEEEEEEEEEEDQTLTLREATGRVPTGLLSFTTSALPGVTSIHVS